MRLVAGITGNSTRVICGDDLGKGLWFGAVGFVTAGADDGGVEFRRFDGCRIVGVFCLGSMASLAGDHNMLAEFLLVDNVGVASLANVMSSVRDGTGRGLGDGIAAIVAILPKTVGYDRRAQEDEGNQRDRDHDGKTNQVLGVLEQDVFPAPCGRMRTKKRNDLGYWGIRGATMIEITSACDGGHLRLQQKGLGWASDGITSVTYADNFLDANVLLS